MLTGQSTLHCHSKQVIVYNLFIVNHNDTENCEHSRHNIELCAPPGTVKFNTQCNKINDRKNKQQIDHFF